MNTSNDIRDRKMSVTRASKLENIPYEEQAKFVNDRLVNTEDSLAKICTAFSLYIKKMSSLRNATDGLALVLHEYATDEKINKSLKSHILHFSEFLASIGDSRDVEVKQLDSHLLKELSHYQMYCMNAKAEVKSILSLKEKELNKRKQLQKLKNRNPYNRDRIIKAEASHNVTMGSISKSLKELEEHINQFEKKKLQDIKSLLMKFITIELSHHSTAVQIYTNSFTEINKINVPSDMRDFELIMKNNISENTLRKQDMKKDINSFKYSHSSTMSDGMMLKSFPKQEPKLQQLNNDTIQSDTDVSTSDSYSVVLVSNSDRGKDGSLNPQKKYVVHLE